MYATSMKDRLVSAARAKARELQEAAKPGSAAPELEEALDAAEGRVRPASPAAHDADDPADAAADDDDEAGDGDGPVVAAS